VFLSEWKGIYDKPTCTVVPTTVPSNAVASEHFYQALRHAYKKDAVIIMDGYTVSLHGKGIELFHQSLLIFNPKWPAPDHSNKIIEFYKFFRSPDMSIDTYSSQYKRWVSQLDYNSIVIHGN